MAPRYISRIIGAIVALGVAGAVAYAGTYVTFRVADGAPGLDARAKAIARSAGPRTAYKERIKTGENDFRIINYFPGSPLVIKACTDDPDQPFVEDICPPGREVFFRVNDHVASRTTVAQLEEELEAKWHAPGATWLNHTITPSMEGRGLNHREGDYNNRIARFVSGAEQITIRKYPHVYMPQEPKSPEIIPTPQPTP